MDTLSKQLLELQDTPVSDPQVIQPDHYTRYPIEPVEFSMVNELPFWLGNVVKYTTRAGHKLYPNKNAVESALLDLGKAKRYIEMHINQLNGVRPL